MFVSYYPNPCCGEEKKVFVSRKRMTGCFLSKQNVNMVIFTICVSKLREMSHGTKEMLDTADRFWHWQKEIRLPLIKAYIGFKLLLYSCHSKITIKLIATAWIIILFIALVSEENMHCMGLLWWKWMWTHESCYLDHFEDSMKWKLLLPSMIYQILNKPKMWI